MFRPSLFSNPSINAGVNAFAFASIAANLRTMESLTLVLVSDPSKTRTVSFNSWKHWSKVKGFDPNEFRAGAGTEVWRLVDAEFLAAQRDVKAAPRKPIQMPEEIRRVVAPKVEEVPVTAPDELVSDVVSDPMPSQPTAKVKKK